MKPVLFSSKQLYWRQHCHYSVQCWFSSKSPLHSHTSQNHCSNYMNLINMDQCTWLHTDHVNPTHFFQCCLFIPQFHDWKCSLATHWLVKDIYHIVTIILSWKTEISLFKKISDSEISASTKVSTDLQAVLLSVSDLRLNLD